MSATVLLLAFCWAHVRRDFIRDAKGYAELKTWALSWLRRIRDLYRLNGQRLEVPSDTPAYIAADQALRQAVAAMQQQRDMELADPNLRLPCRRTLSSLQEHWPGLTLFVDDPRIPMDNNASERRVRGPALGRKNYYGSGSLWSGRLAAMLFSIFATLDLAQLNPRAWLRWYLDSCAAAGGQAPSEIEEFLPWNLTPERRAALSASVNEPVPTFEGAKANRPVGHGLELACASLTSPWNAAGAKRSCCAPPLRRINTLQDLSNCLWRNTQEAPKSAIKGQGSSVSNQGQGSGTGSLEHYFLTPDS